MRLLALTLLLLAGCVAPALPVEVGSAVDACGAVVGTQNAPLAPGMRGEPVEVARRLATAVGDPLASDRPELVDGERWIRWPTERGAVTWERHADDDGVTLTWDLHADEPLPPRAVMERTLRAAIDSLGGDPARMRWAHEEMSYGHRVMAWQTYRGEIMDHGMSNWMHGMARMMLVGPQRELPPDDLATRSDAELRSVAERYLQCRLAEEEVGAYTLSPGELRWRAHHGTLARLVPFQVDGPEQGHCGRPYQVLVDAVTAKPLGFATFYCD